MNNTAVTMQATAEDISETVVAAVGEYKGIDMIELNPPLYEAIDPDSLDDLFRDSQGIVRFNHWGCTITVDHDGVVTVTNGEDNR